MKLRLLLPLACLLAWVNAGADTVFEKSREEMSLYYQVLIDETGQLKTAQPLRVVDRPVQLAGIAAIKAIGFEPALRDGKATTMETGLHLVVRFVKQPDGNYRTLLKSARLGPLVAEGGGLEIRSNGPASATAVLIVSAPVRADGSVDPAGVAVLQSATSKNGRSRLPRFEQESLDAVRGWRFAPDLVGGQPVSSVAEAIVRYCTTDCTVPAEPEPSSERMALPVSLTPGVQLARVKALPAN